jgi:hypothetical protein
VIIKLMAVTGAHYPTDFIEPFMDLRPGHRRYRISAARPRV